MSAVGVRVKWLVSPNDGRSHIFDNTREGARAVCGSVPPDNLTEPTADTAPCLVCLTTRGREIAVEQGRADEHMAVWSPL